jgi:hypothetical protein
MARSKVRRWLKLGLLGCTVLLMPGAAAIPVSAHDSSRTTRPTNQRAATLACFHVLGPNEVNEPQYGGLTLAKASAKARNSGMSITRIVAENGRCLSNTLDLRSDRVNFWVYHGHVIQARRF